MRRAAALLVASACVAGGGAAEPPSPESLGRPDAHPVLSRTGDLDADGGPEVVVASVSDAPTSFGLPTPYLEVFGHREGRWRRVFDASGQAPPGDGTPSVMLQRAEEGFASGQSINVLELVDFAGDGSSEIVVAVSNAGATAGPLELWIVSMDGEPRTEYYVRTERGGNVAVEGEQVTLEFGVYRRDDPGCCPSILERRTIGHDGQWIVTLDRERRRVASG